MSQVHKVQDATGRIVQVDADLVLDIVSAGTPTNGQSGYAVGCTWRNKSGGVASTLYVNVGSTTSTTWVNIA